MRREIVFGPPGTGKTTTLLEKAKAALARGKVGFVSFSRRALTEARERLGVSGETTEHFRTIHATAFHLLGLSRVDVIDTEHLTEFGERIGFEVQTVRDEFNWDGSPADVALALYHLAKARQTSVEHEYHLARVDVPWNLVEHVVELYTRWKKRSVLWDFSDMIEQAEGHLPVDTLFVDEAQDTSTAQWAMLHRIAAHVPEVIIAGDDDQAVYAWSGADPEYLLRLKGERRVLDLSYRLPETVKALADTITARMGRRVPKAFRPRPERGAVEWLNDLEQVDLRDGKTWLLLGRSNYQLKDLRELAREQGVVYSLPDGRWSWALPCVRAALAYEQLRRGKPITRPELRALLLYLDPRPPAPAGRGEVTWAEVFGERSKGADWMEALSAMGASDREYVRALRRHGESLKDKGRVRIQTVHGAKGGQADHVVLVTDVSERVATAQQVDPDAELRVQYVGVTRARERLLLLRPRSTTFWEF